MTEKAADSELVRGNQNCLSPETPDIEFAR